MNETHLRTLKPKKKRPKKAKPTVGWKEWVMLPALSAEPIHAKIDTGARTSALHVETLRIVETDDGRFAEFGFFKPRKDEKLSDRFFPFRARLVDRRKVKSSTGHEQIRAVIKTDLAIAGIIHPIEITLTDRTRMEFPMLVGRSALRRHVIVDPGRSYLGSGKSRLPDSKGKAE